MTSASGFNLSMVRAMGASSLVSELYARICAALSSSSARTENTYRILRFLAVMIFIILGNQRFEQVRQFHSYLHGYVFDFR